MTVATPLTALQVMQDAPVIPVIVLNDVAHAAPMARALLAGGPLAKLLDGDVVRLDAIAGTLQALVPDDEWAARPLATMPDALRVANGLGMGRELFSGMRRNALTAEQGALTWM